MVPNYSLDAGEMDLDYLVHERVSSLSELFSEVVRAPGSQLISASPLQRLILYRSIISFLAQQAVLDIVGSALRQFVQQHQANIAQLTSLLDPQLVAVLQGQSSFNPAMANKASCFCLELCPVFPSSSSPLIHDRAAG